MNIAFDAQPMIESQKTGVGFCEAGIIKALLRMYNDNDYSFDFFCFRNEEEKTGRLMPFSEYAKTFGLNLSFNKCKWLPGSLYRILWSFFQIPYRVLFRREADITHFFNYLVPPGLSGKKVCTVHDMAYKAYPKTVRLKTKAVLNTALKRSCKRSDLIVTVSEFSKKEIIKYLKVAEEKVVVVPNGVDSTLFGGEIDQRSIEKVKEKYGIEGDYFLYLGTLEPRKNIERLIEAYSLLISTLGEGAGAGVGADVGEGAEMGTGVGTAVANRSEQASAPEHASAPEQVSVSEQVLSPDLGYRTGAEHASAPKLVLAGRKGWLYNSIFDLVSRLNLANDVIFTGYVDDEDVAVLMRGALSFVFPSLYEGFGMPVLEAMACGTPVLTSNTSSLPEVAGDAAILVDPFSVREISEGLAKLYNDGRLRAELSKKGRERAKLFSWEHSAEILMKAYEKLTRSDV